MPGDDLDEVKRAKPKQLSKNEICDVIPFNFQCLEKGSTLQFPLSGPSIAHCSKVAVPVDVIAKPKPRRAYGTCDRKMPVSPIRPTSP